MLPGPECGSSAFFPCGGWCPSAPPIVSFHDGQGPATPEQRIRRNSRPNPGCRAACLQSTIFFVVGTRKETAFPKWISKRLEPPLHWKTRPSGPKSTSPFGTPATNLPTGRAQRLQGAGRRQDAAAVDHGAAVRPSYGGLRRQVAGRLSSECLLQARFKA